MGRSEAGPGRLGLPLAGERGAALITVLLVAALATILAVALATRQQVDIRRTANILDSDQALVMALGVESWGRQLLARDGGKSKSDSLAEDWAQLLVPTEVEGGMVSGLMEDMQGRFNLNDLDPASELHEAALVDFTFLLHNCEGGGELIDPVLDWLDADSNIRDFGAEDGYYLGLDQPYRPANSLLADPSELLLVKGMSRELFNCLAPHVTALPEVAGRINVNTAGAVVLAGLESGRDLKKVEELLANRSDKGYSSVEEFVETAAGLGLEYKPEVQKLLSVESSFFMARAQGRLGRGSINLESLLYRDPASNQVTLVRRTINR